MKQLRLASGRLSILCKDGHGDATGGEVLYSGVPPTGREEPLRKVLSIAKGGRERPLEVYILVPIPQDILP